jgi:hypothetical protein
MKRGGGEKKKLKKDQDTPTRIPPSEKAEGYATASGTEPQQQQPSEVLLKEAKRSQMETEAIPFQTPTGEAMQGITAAVWHSNKKINALWSNNGNRNVWVAIADVGWRKLADNSDSAIMALTIITSHAFQTNRTANLMEDGGQIREVYVW